MTDTHNNKGSRQTFTGTVVSDKMKDTIVVEIRRFTRHPKYGKYISTSQRFKAHDAGNTKKVGDVVTITACAPISKDKRFTLAA